MRISLIAAGSRGDTQPIVALAAALNARGHRAEIVSFDEFAPLAAEHGVALKTFSQDIRAEMESARSQALLARGGDPLVFLRWFIDLGRRYARIATQEIADYAQGSDLIVGSGLSDPLAQAVARSRALPYVHAYLQPLLPSREYPPAFHAGHGLPLPGWLNRLEQTATAELMWLAVRPLIRIPHEMLGLEPPPVWSGALQAVKRGEPFLMGWSPLVAPPSRDWPRSVQVTGYWFLDAAPAWTPPKALTYFLQSGPPPVYFGFGSMGLRDAQKTSEMVLAAIEKTGCRAIVSLGWGGLGRDAPLPNGVLGVDAVPHDWLLPRMAAAVHHGGAGTTAAAMRAGIPSVITPFLADQFFWGRRVEALGVGPRAVPQGRLTTERLARAVSAAVGDGAMRARAADLGAQLAGEDGLGRACALIAQAAEAGPRR